MKRFLDGLGRQQDIIFVMLFGLIVAMLIIPMPTIVVDTLIATNIVISVIIIISALYLRNVLDLSTFPAIILLTTLFRLALTVSTTRLILADADAGHIIAAFGNFVVSGNVVVGLVIFLIVAIVQFLVVTKGAERIAEVTARFTLDALPGKQMAIDADVRAGQLTAEEAQQRRFKLEKESQFFGSMDGAMRFVKGDAIAGLVIVAVNLIGGMLIGILQKDLSAGEAFSTYTLLTVGDGLIGQIPSMFIAVAAGIIVTRVVKEDAKDVGRDITRQLAEQPRPLAVAAAFCMALALIPGFPAPVFIVLALLLGAAAASIFVANGGRLPFGRQADPDEAPAEQADPKDVFIDPTPAPILELVGPASLKRRLESAGVARRINDRFLALQAASGLPVMLPGYRIDDTADGVSFHVEGRAHLAFTPDQCRDVETVVDAVMEETRFNLYRTFDLEIAAFWLKDLGKGFSRMTAEIERSVPLMMFTEVVRRMAAHNVSIRQPRPLFEAMLKPDDSARSALGMASSARRLLAPMTQHDLRRAGGTLHLVVFAPGSEALLSPFTVADVSKLDLAACDRSELGRMLATLRQTVNETPRAIIVCEMKAGFGLQHYCHERGLRAWVLSPEEMPEDAETDVLHVFSAPAQPSNAGLGAFRRADRPAFAQ